MQNGTVDLFTADRGTSLFSWKRSKRFIFDIRTLRAAFQQRRPSKNGSQNVLFVALPVF